MPKQATEILSFDERYEKLMQRAAEHERRQKINPEVYLPIEVGPAPPTRPEPILREVTADEVTDDMVKLAQRRNRELLTDDYFESWLSKQRETHDFINNRPTTTGISPRHFVLSPKQKLPPAPPPLASSEPFTPAEEYSIYADSSVSPETSPPRDIKDCCIALEIQLIQNVKPAWDRFGVSDSDMWPKKYHNSMITMKEGEKLSDALHGFVGVEEKIKTNLDLNYFSNYCLDVRALLMKLSKSMFWEKDGQDASRVLNVCFFVKFGRKKEKVIWREGEHLVDDVLDKFCKAHCLNDWMRLDLVNAIQKSCRELATRGTPKPFSVNFPERSPKRKSTSPSSSPAKKKKTDNFIEEYQPWEFTTAATGLPDHHPQPKANPQKKRHATPTKPLWNWTRDEIREQSMKIHQAAWDKNERVNKSPPRAKQTYDAVDLLMDKENSYSVAGNRQPKTFQARHPNISKQFKPAPRQLKNDAAQYKPPKLKDVPYSVDRWPDVPMRGGANFNKRLYR